MLRLERVGKIYPTGEVLRDVTWEVKSGDRIGLVGVNGAGKSTQLRIIAGLEEPSSGQVVRQGDPRIVFLQQEFDVDVRRTVREELFQAFGEAAEVRNQQGQVELAMASERAAEDPDHLQELIEELGRLQTRFEGLHGYELDARIDKLLPTIGFNEAKAERLVGDFSGGWQMRIALGKILLQEPDLLLLDEPTNHLDAESVHWLEQHLAQYEGTIIAVTHDRYFLDNVAGWILELDRGEGIPWEGNYSTWLEQKRKRLELEERGESKRQKALKRELEWVQKSPSGRQAKNKARIERYEQLADQRGKGDETEVEILVAQGPRLGTKVIEVKDIAKAYGENLLFQDLSFSVPPGAIVGIVGANGAGKTTLFRMITGHESPDQGAVELGETVKLAHVGQFRDELPDNETVWEAISGGSDELDFGGRTLNSRAYVNRFGFTGNDQSKEVGVLSGGERNRVHLARLLRDPSNVMLLDEPNNDLDVNTMRALEEAIGEYAGCVLVISHDRWFLDRVATHILAFEGDSEVRWFEGGWTLYEADRRRRLGDAAVNPTRLKYRKLTRS